MKNENGIEKSAILKGQTLVNLFRVNEEKEFGGAVCGYKDGKLQFIFGDDWAYSYTSGIKILKDCSPLVKGKKYYYRLELSRTPSTQVAINSHNTTTHTHIYVYASCNTAGSNQTLFTGTFIANEHDRVGVYVVDETNGETITGTFMVLEYIEGMENWDIPYFEGMQSVKNSQTLVNLSPKFNKTFTPNGSWILIGTSANGFVGGKKYLIIPTLTDISFNIQTTNNIAIIGVTKKSVFTYPIDGSGGVYYYCNAPSMETEITPEFVVLEYQDGMENWDISYFEGMQSVKMPVLKTQGKNLFNKNNIIVDGYIISNGTLVYETGDNRNAADFIEVEPNYTYSISGIMNSAINGGRTHQYVAMYDENKTFISSATIYCLNDSATFTTTENTKYIRLTVRNDDINRLQIEKGTTATTYEPYKSNILTVNEDIELRGIGNVQDTLDCSTGEVTERIGEIVLDGSEEWKIEYNTFRTTVISNKVFNQTNSTDRAKHHLTSDKYASRTYIDSWESGKFIALHVSKEIVIKDGDFTTTRDWVQHLQQNPVTVQYRLATESVKTVVLTVTDQDNQPQERMKLFPKGYINTSSSTFPPILELKGITRNNKLSMATTNGTNNTQLTTLDNLVLDGIICRDGTVVRDSYDVESGLYTKRVFRFTIDEDFIERYKDKFSKYAESTTTVELNMNTTAHCKYPSPSSEGACNNIEYSHAGNKNRVAMAAGQVWITLVKEELKSYDVDGLLDWIKRNGAIEVAYQMATPQIIHMQPNMQPYVSTRPYQGSIESQGNILESSFLDYTSEQSIISPKPLGDGDVLRWEQGSQCYVYENDKEYIPLTDYNQPMGTVLDLDEEDGEQFVENVDGGDIVVDVPFKEKAVYERHLVSHEDNVIYPIQDKLDPTGKIEVDYICGETWQNPDDLSDIRHVGTLREDGQYDVTIRRSGDDEIRLMDGTTHLSLDGDGLNPSEFELTFFNKGGVEVGKYGDTIHILEDCVLDSKLETGTVYGDTMVNLVDTSKIVNQTTGRVDRDSDGWITITGLSGSWTYAYIKKMQNLKPDTLYTIIIDIAENTLPYDMEFIQNSSDSYLFSRFTRTYSIPSKQTGRIIITRTTKNQDVFDNYIENYDFRIQLNTTNVGKIKFRFMVLEGDYTNYPTTIPFFEGVGSTVVNGFTTTSKNLFDKTKIINNKYQNCEVSSGNFNISTNTNYMISDYIKVSPNTTYTKTNFYIYGAYYDQDKQAIKTTSITSNTFTTPSNAYYIVLNFRKEIDDYENAQLELNTLSTPYEPYKGITYNLPTPITLNKVGDVADTYDVVGGVETRKVVTIVPQCSQNPLVNDDYIGVRYAIPSTEAINSANFVESVNNLGLPFINNDLVSASINSNFGEAIGRYLESELKIVLAKSRLNLVEYNKDTINKWLQDNLILYIQAKTPKTIQHTLIPSTVETMQEPTFILPQPLRSVPNGICDRLYWDENKGHYCIEKRVEELKIPLYDDSKTTLFSYSTSWIYRYTIKTNAALFTNPVKLSNNIIIRNIDSDSDVLTYSDRIDIYVGLTSRDIEANLIEDLTNRQRIVYYALATSEIIDLPHLNKKLTLPTQPDTLPIGYKVESQVNNPQLGLTIPYKQLNYPSRPQNIDFKMDIADYVLTWDDVKEARQYNIILNDKVIATTKEPQWNSGEEMYGYIMVEAQNELAENLSEELYIKTVPNAPAQLTVAHNPMTDYYDFEISFIKTSAIAEYYTVQYRIDNGEWVYKTIQSDEIDPNSKVLWSFSVYEINEQIEVWATATNEIGTNDILPTAIYYMSPTPQWTYRINSKELFVRWMDDSPYDTQYKLRYQYKSDGIFRYAYFEGDKQEIGKLYEALIPLADDEEVAIALCIISEKENLYTKPIKASKELDPNIKPPKNFNYHWLARGLIEFYWEDNYEVDVEYEAIVEHRLTSGNNEWITDTRIFSATDTEGTGTVYRLSYQLEDLEEIRVKVRMKWAMNETEWSESLTTVFIPVEGNPPQWIRRTQTQEGLLVEWEAQEYVDSYHVYIMSNGEELQHLETMDNFVLVDLDYNNPIDIEIYEATRFSGGIQSDPSDSMRFRPTMDKQQMIYNVVTPDTLTYEIEVDTIQKGIKERQVIHDINTTPKVTSKQPMDVSISSPFTLSFHPLQLDVHQAGAKYYGDAELHIKTLDVKSRDAIEVLSFERITDQYGVDFTVYTPSASKYPITLEVNRVRIVCFGDSLTSGHPGFWAETGTGDPQHCYEYWLDRRLKGQYEIINKGYGSDTTDRMLARFDRDVLANNPQYCIIQGGTNDLYWAMAESMGDQEALDMKLDVMKANIMEMVKRCWDNNIVPIVGNLIPRTGATGIYKTALYDFNAWIISWCTGQAAEGRNIFYVDLFNAGKEAVPPTPIEDPTNPGAMNPIYDGDALFDEFGNIIKQGRGIHLNKEGYRIWAEAIPLSIFKTYDSGLRMYKDLHCTDEDNYDDSDKQNPFYTISIDNVRRSKTKTVVRYIKNIGKTQVLFAMYASDEYNMSIEFVGSDGEKGAYANGLLAPNMIAKVTMEINLDNKDSKASFNLHLAAREYNQN